MSGIQLKVSVARRQPTLDSVTASVNTATADNSSASWSSIGLYCWLLHPLVHHRVSEMDLRPALCGPRPVILEPKCKMQAAFEAKATK